ncbi:MAG: 3-hydroxyacyl-CoA dehydrogenase [Gammaproteobacteria bacterium]|nr:MAG: 3-hydroxyacyl-CoA dehydrogenase [Gammaproteobacteria bacterium]
MLAQQGARVVVADPGADRGGRGSEEAPANQVVAEIEAAGGQAISALAPVDEFDAAASIIGACHDAYGSVDILVNCAGVLRERMIWNLSEDDWDTVIRVHLKGHYNMCHHAAKAMRGQRFGRIINFASDAWRGSVGQANYAAAKGGIVSFTRSLARELGRYGVTANAICPLAATRMTLDQGVIDGFKKRLEAGLITQERYDSLMAMPGPEFVAPMVAYLGTDAAADINGEVFHVERGRVSVYAEPVEEKMLLKTENDGLFSVEDLIDSIPGSLMVGRPNPAPAEQKDQAL